MIIVSRTSFFSAVQSLIKSKILALDTETTGLRWFREHSLFSIIIASASEEFYFNFHSKPDIPENYQLRPEHLKLLKGLLEKKDILWYMHNAKFDLHHLKRVGLEVGGEVHCTMAASRLLNNNTHVKLTLNNCLKMIPMSDRDPLISLVKDDSVDKYITSHGLSTKMKVPGKKTAIKDKHFDQVPFDLISKYGCQDGRITYILGEWQRNKINFLSNGSGTYPPKLNGVYENEKKITKVCQKMEWTGIKIDEEYCKKAFDYELGRANDSARRFTEETGEQLVDSGKALSKIFAKYGEKPTLTEKGNPSYTDDVLALLKSPPAQILREHRTALKKVSTYYSSFLFYATDGVIHPDLKQAGTVTGRFSASNPNLQNIPKRGEDESEYPVRRAFVPRDGRFLVSIDYSQMEYRMLIDLAGEKELARSILEDGIDVHEGTARMMGSTRDNAKTINFMLLYGGGAAKLATALGISLYEAKLLRSRYFHNLAYITNFSKLIIRTAEARREAPLDYIFSWCGRQYRFPDINFCYTAPNHYIQGGCADVIKIAMPRIDAFLEDKKSKMLLQVHDELIFEMPEEELGLIPDIQDIMVKVYPHKILPMSTEASYSRKSWHDMEDYVGAT